jgi:L-lactate dehydrogenase (cytochrome)
MIDHRKHVTTSWYFFRFAFFMSPEHLRVIAWEEVRRHASRSSSWAVIHGRVYDLTKFIDEYPGGPAVLLRVGGTDATYEFDKYHPKAVLQLLPPAAVIGRIEEGTRPEPDSVSSPLVRRPSLPNLDSILSSYDFIDAAAKVLSSEAWGYMASAAEDEVTSRSNGEALSRIWIKPRVLVPISFPISTSVDLIGGFRSTSPIYISATARGRLYHPYGEIALARAAGLAGVVQMCPTLASCSLDEMAHARIAADQCQWYQLYVNPDKGITKGLLRRAEALGMRALCITVDVVILGKRERDQRTKIVSDIPDVQKGFEKNIDRTRGVSRALVSFIYPGLTWDHIAWIRSITKLPIILKGVQTFDDALIAYKSGICSGIIVSNHGGRQVDFARPTVDCLYEIITRLKSVGVKVNDGFDVYVDGGIRRGSDVFKYLGIGAKAVGIGRSSLCALATHGADGVGKLLDILTDELKSVMMHTGCSNVGQIEEHMLDTRSLSVPLNGNRFASGLHESRLYVSCTAF